MNLSLGAGQDRQDGWTTLDVDPTSGADLIEDMTTLESIQDASCDQILSCHSLEHVYHFQVIPTLQLWFAKLKPGGKITFYLPDPRSFWSLFLQGQMHPARVLAVTYGVQNTQNPWDIHKTAFWPELLRETLKEIGFVRITDIKPRYDTEFGMTALKPK